MRPQRWRRGEINVVKILVFLGIFAGLFWSYAFLPHYWTHMEMEEVVQVSLLTWRDKNKARAMETLEHELKKREIPSYIIPEDCEFYEEENRRHMECFWAVDVKYPLIEKRKTLEFVVNKYLDENDNLYDWEG
jgi:hypothetical protein